MEKTGGSRLMQMQARFQQKQLQERELKIASLYEAQQARALDRVRHSPSNGVVNGSKQTSPPPEPKVPMHPGKVRQMFEERRTKAGIDKSYPLQPIHNTDRPKKPLPNNYNKVTHASTNGHTRVTNTSHVKTSSKVVEKKRTVTRDVKIVKQSPHKTKNIVNGSGDLNHNHEIDLNEIKRSLPQSNGEPMPGLDKLDSLDKDNNYLLEDETFPDALAPIPTPRSPEPKEPKRPPRRSPTNRASNPKPDPVAPPRRAASDNAVSKSKPKEAMQCATNSPRKTPSPLASKTRAPPPRSVRKTAAASAASPSSDAGAACAVCGRRFAADRLQRHEEICRRASQKKRKPFDALKHRLAGTEAEPFIGKLRRQQNSTSTTKVSKPLNSNWRQKHEEFIQAIRAAKQVQAHLDAGGNLKDLPPPPPSENPDYVQCPHCKRRFNSGAAERHIPKCASYQFNKPKPQAKGSRR